GFHAARRRRRSRPSARALVPRVRGGLGALLVLRHAGAPRALSHALPAAAREPRARRGLRTVPSRPRKLVRVSRDTGDARRRDHEALSRRRLFNAGERWL